ncbi:MAG: hypothetical protein ACYTEX_11235 [Planctomycetota bacterium]|jgi:hypothetical protein
MLKKIERDGVSFTVGDDGDFSMAEMDSLRLQIERWNTHNQDPDKKPIKRLSPKMARAVLGVKRVFPDAVIEHDPGPALDVRAFLEKNRK